MLKALKINCQENQIDHSPTKIPSPVATNPTLRQKPPRGKTLPAVIHNTQQSTRLGRPCNARAFRFIRLYPFSPTQHQLYRSSDGQHPKHFSFLSAMSLNTLEVRPKKKSASNKVGLIPRLIQKQFSTLPILIPTMERDGKENGFQVRHNARHRHADTQHLHTHTHTRPTCPRL